MAVFDFDKLVLSFELTLYTPYMLKISPIIRQSDTEFPYWPQCATRIEIYGSEGLMIVGRHGGGWQVFARPKLHEGVVKDQKKGRFPDPEHKAELRRLRPHAEDAQRRHRRRPPQHAAGPLGQHQLPPGRAEADDRRQDREDRRQRRGDEASTDASTASRT